MSAQDVHIIAELSTIPAEDWNALSHAADYPYLRHEFLVALEQNDCLGEKFGWYPQHLAIYDDGKLVAAAPMYVKTNSYGEFVFDWSWASAYERQGKRYYPKLISGAPYTPATGPKLLVGPGQDEEALQTQLAHAAVALAKAQECSSVHWLFTPEEETSLLTNNRYERRIGCQFHWSNEAYKDFDHYLSFFSSSKRKNVRKERKKVTDAGFTFEWLNGYNASNADWQEFHTLYEDTFDKYGGWATLSLAFFQQIAKTMPDNVLLVQAKLDGKVIATAFNLVGKDTLYGRHWGCHADYHSLHFEACYYQGLEYCIQHGLKRFEPGAQGEHKIARGFLPQQTDSAHLMLDPEFDAAIKNFLKHETEHMFEYIDEMHTRSPFKQS